MSSLVSNLNSSTAQKIVTWVTTADGCVHTADATRQSSRVGVGGVYWALDNTLNDTIMLVSSGFNFVVRFASQGSFPWQFYVNSPQRI